MYSSVLTEFHCLIDQNVVLKVLTYILKNCKFIWKLETAHFHPTWLDFGLIVVFLSRYELQRGLSAASSKHTNEDDQEDGGVYLGDGEKVVFGQKQEQVSDE